MATCLSGCVRSARFIGPPILSFAVCFHFRPEVRFASCCETKLSVGKPWTSNGRSSPGVALEEAEDPSIRLDALPPEGEGVWRFVGVSICEDAVGETIGEGAVVAVLAEVGEGAAPEKMLESKN